MPTQNVNLSDHFAQFIRNCVASGHYNNASEVVRTALRLLEQQQEEHRMKLERLQSLTSEAFEALDRGEYNTYSSETIHELFDRVDSKIRMQP